MGALTTDQYIQFVIENYSDIQALLELVEHTKKNLPPLVNYEIQAAILELEAGYFHEQGLFLKENIDEPEIWWYDPSVYDIKTYEGAYFGFEPSIQWSNIISGSPEDPATLFLYIEVGAAKGKKASQDYIRRGIDALRANEAKLRKSGLILWYNLPYFSFNNPYVVGYPLHKEIDPTSLVNKESFHKGIQEATKIFTSTLLPILKDVYS